MCWATESMLSRSLRREAGLCTSANTVRYDVQSNAIGMHHVTCIGYRYRTHGGLFNAARLQEKIKVEKDWVRDILFADGCALNAATEAKMQQSMNQFSASCRGPWTNHQYEESRNQVSVYSTAAVLGTLYHCRRRDPEGCWRFFVPRQHGIDSSEHRLGGGQTHRQSQLHIRTSKGIGVRQKTEALDKKTSWKCIIRPTHPVVRLWNRLCTSKYSVASTSNASGTLKITWKDRVPDTDVLEQAGMTSVHTLLQQAHKPIKARHILHKRDTHLPKRDCSFVSYQTASALEEDQSCNPRAH